jgi:hypothetical protein
LSDDGRLVVVAHNPVETAKLVFLSLEVLKQRGIANGAAMKQLSVIGSHHFPAFILKKTPFSDSEMVSVHQSLHELGFDPTLSYLPVIKLASGNVSHSVPADYDKCSAFSPLFMAASLGQMKFNQTIQEAAQGGFDIKPATDNNPSL